MRERIYTHLAEHAKVTADLAKLEDTLLQAVTLCADTLGSGGKILLCGNGGSAGDAQHIAAELVGRLVHDRPSLAAIALTTDTSALTAIANDYGYEQVFARQIAGLGRPGDLLIAISTSGNSDNISRAVECAKQGEMATVGFIGKGGGALADLVDVPLIVPSDTTARIQEAHILLGHMLCDLIELKLGYSQ